MNTFNNINSGETGHSVRGKLNQVLSEITGGSEGINAIWNRLDSLYQYINAMDGGVGGLIKDTSYDPSVLDTSKSAVLISLGAGTFSNLKNAQGVPITITQVNSFTVFFREAGTDYWQYVTTVIEPSVEAVLSNTFEESADSVQMTKDGKPVHPVTKTDLVFSPDGENLKNTLTGLKAVSSGVVDISVIDSLWNQTGIYCLTSGEHSSDSTPTSVGFLIVFQDSLREHCYQRLIGNYEDPNSGFTSPTDEIYQTWVRSTAIYNGARGDWTSWKSFGATIVNDLTTGGADKALSAEMGKVLGAELTELEKKQKYIGVTDDMNTNKMIPELYLTGLDKSKVYNIYAINNSDVARSVYIYDSNIANPDASDIYVALAYTKDFSQDLLEVESRDNSGISGWIVVNWDIVPKGSINPYSIIQHEAVNNLANNPRIASEIQLGVARDDMKNQITGAIVDDLFTDDPKKALSARIGKIIADIQSDVNSVVGGTIYTKYGVEDLGILRSGRYINLNSGTQEKASTCIITNSIYLESGDIITAYTGGTGIAVIAKSESQATTSTVFTPLVTANNMGGPITYKVEEAGYYAFSGRNQQQGDLALVVEVLKHSESKGSINEVMESLQKVDDLIEGKLEVTEYTLDDLNGEGALINYYANNKQLKPLYGANCIITKPIYLNVGDEVDCVTGGTGMLLVGRVQTAEIKTYTSIESISDDELSYKAVISEAGWYVFSGRINRTDGTNLVVNVKSYKREESLQEKLDKKVDKSDISSFTGGNGYALSVGADMVKDAVPAEPWFDEVSNDGTTYGTYLDDKIDSVPEGDSFIFISDVHYNGNRKQSAKLIDYVRRRLGIKTVIHGGDVINEASTVASAAKEWLDFNRDFVFRIGGDFKQVCGDHDHNGRFADTGQAFSYQFVQRVLNGYNIKELHYDTIYDEQVKEIAVANGWSDNDMKEYNAWKKMHYYFDDSTIKTRFIILHTGWTGDVGLAVEKLGSNVLSEPNALYLQMDFLHQSLLSAPSNYNVVAIGHNAIGNKGYSTTVDGTEVLRYNVNEPVWKGQWHQVAKMLRAFKNKSSVGLYYRDWSGSGVQTKLFDFASANTPNIVFCMGGDVHWDIMCKSTENSETLEPISVATSLDKIIVTEGSVSASDIPHILTMTDGGDRGYRGIITPIDSSYNDATDSVQLSASNTAGTLNSQAFDIVTITDNGIYMTRIGSANDRVIHIE